LRRPRSEVVRFFASRALPRRTRRPENTKKKGHRVTESQRNRTRAQRPKNEMRIGSTSGLRSRPAGAAGSEGSVSRRRCRPVHGSLRFQPRASHRDAVEPTSSVSLRLCGKHSRRRPLRPLRSCPTRTSRPPYVSCHEITSTLIALHLEPADARLLDLVVRGHLEQRRCGLAADDALQTIRRIAVAWILAIGQHQHLQIG
jgi:hypothetical protein